MSARMSSSLCFVLSALLNQVAPGCLQPLSVFRMVGDLSRASFDRFLPLSFHCSDPFSPTYGDGPSEPMCPFASIPIACGICFATLLQRLRRIIQNCSLTSVGVLYSGGEYADISSNVNSLCIILTDKILYS